MNAKYTTLNLYKKAVNEIDDYFEYRCLSVKQKGNKKFINNILNKLTKNLVKINTSNNN